MFTVGEKAYGAGAVGLTVSQIILQKQYFVKEPLKNDVKNQAPDQLLIELGILMAGLSIGHHGPL